ncbi:MIF4G-like type 3 [Macrophomina phaseolina MS6]|uniref:MIF4G-like type 3 n=1 Tax=Macrophomina phaseolina (strain MS6) TaxID=1126212 RepID=K2RYH4_MACPH|nr:MIF4G-like type 3 [Macrophomina phaseolina MS6]
MRPRTNGGPKLPRELLDQIGASGSSKSNGRHRGSVLGRKDRRRAEREQKKSQRRQPRQFQHHAPRDTPENDEDEGASSPPPKPAKPEKRKAEEKPLKPALKRAEAAPEKSSRKDKGAKENTKAPTRKAKKEPSLSPSPSPPPIPKKVKAKLDEDDAEIAALEKKLGIKNKKKLPKGFEDDGLADLLDGLDDELDFAVTGKRKRSSEDQAWLESKRRKAAGGLAVEESFSDDDSEEGEDGWEDEESMGFGDEDEDGVDGGLDDEDGESADGDGFAGFSDKDVEDVEDAESSEGDLDDLDEETDAQDGESEREEQRPKVRENPYKPPIPTEAVSAGKYVPPSLRGPPSSDAEAMTRLRRQAQGLLNRLSEANLLSILKDIENLYQNNPRQYVTTTLIDLLLGLVCDRTSLQDTFLILHAGFISAVYKVIGTDFGAQLVERLAAEFDKCYSNYSEESSGKETTNLISLISEMYNFQVIGCNLVFDYIRIFLEELKEVNTELLLRIVRMSGPQLRQDDPTSLKDIVILLQKSVAKAGEANLSVRTKFMIETINNLKNNRMKTGVAASAITSEHTTRMKKTLGSLNTRSIKASEPLRIGLKDLRDTEKKGKWWLVGASWRNDTTDEREITAATTTDDKQSNDGRKKEKYERSAEEETIASGGGTTDLMQLAREQRMNTDIRRAIFISIMSASDCKDAHARLTKLRLKRAQELEIPRVLLHCAGAELAYNPYYTLIARRLCAEKPLKKAFQFSLWDLFRRMGERDDADDDDADFDEDGEEALTTRKVVNLARMFGTLAAEGGLSIAVLKVCFVSIVFAFPLLGRALERGEIIFQPGRRIDILSTQTLNFAYLQPKTTAFVEVLLSTLILRSQKTKKGKNTADSGRDEEALLDIVMRGAREAPQMARGLQYFFKKVVSKGEAAGNKADRETVRWGAGVAADGLTVLATQRVDAE